MPDLPAHSDTGDDATRGTGGEPPLGPQRPKPTLWVVVGAVLVIAFILLHLTGVLGPGGH
ncbi:MULTISPECIES: hypothetical protein [unclassified Streptomyces]|uniref:hypothetical protein n=1 Tax=unclassified Streptomyces TaxID=2593676 RepID=UPI002DD8BCF5|nr:hypothetical protein [Streptomyces sp. NBC_00243]WRZ17330.1 hypothetical protein OHT59_01980 [Streptomyces sp. NBC_00243]